MATRFEGLTDAEAKAWRAFLKAHYQIVRKLDAVLLAREGVSLSAYEVLRWLEREPGGRLRMSELADRVMLSRSGVTRVVDHLVADGLVERQRCLADARGTEAVITEAGLARLGELSGIHIEALRQIFIERLDPEALGTLAEILEKVIEPDDGPEAC